KASPPGSPSADGSPVTCSSAGRLASIRPSGCSRTPHSISRPTTAASMITLGSNSRATSMAASNSSARETLVIPMEEPPRAGGTKTGSPRGARSCRRRRLDVLNVHLGVRLPGLLDGRIQLLCALDLGAPDAVAPAGGLDEHGQPEAVPLVLRGRLRARTEDDLLTDRQSGRAENDLGELLVHPGGTREDPGADVRDAGEDRKSVV